jgi:hypothetical protein
MTLHAPSNTVPTADEVANLTATQVIGNKTDTVAGTSLVSLSKQILALAPVTGADNVANVDFVDVVGNKTDTVAGTSLVALAKQLLALGNIIKDGEDYPIIHIPINAADVACTNAGGAYAKGAWVEVIAATANDYRLHSITFNTPSGADIFDIEIGVGAGGGEVAEAEGRAEIATDAGVSVPIKIDGTGIIPAGSRIAARIGSAGGGGATTLRVGVMVQRAS